MNAEPLYFIKTRQKTLRRKPYYFISDREEVTRLRIKAARFTLDNAQKVAAEAIADNPDWQFKIVDSSGQQVPMGCADRPSKKRS